MRGRCKIVIWGNNTIVNIVCVCIHTYMYSHVYIMCIYHYQIAIRNHFRLVMNIN